MPAACAGPRSRRTSGHRIAWPNCRSSMRSSKRELGAVPRAEEPGDGRRHRSGGDHGAFPLVHGRGVVRAAAAEKRADGRARNRRRAHLPAAARPRARHRHRRGRDATSSRINREKYPVEKAKGARRSTSISIDRPSAAQEDDPDQSRLRISMAYCCRVHPCTRAPSIHSHVRETRFDEADWWLY